MHLPADLKPADHKTLRPEHLPQLPAWFPLDPKPTPDDPHPVPHTDVTRAIARHKKACQEAAAGPYDGERMKVYFPDGGEPPEEFKPDNAPHVVYRLDRSSSSKYRLTYRYSPDSPIHHDTMLAVTEAYAGHGRDYVELAREESDEERHAPDPSYFV